MDARRFFAIIFILSLAALASSETIQVTPEHPFFINGSWIKATDLKVGDTLFMSDSGAARITRISKIEKSKIEKNAVVYNIEVGWPHNYFAGGVLVHNKAAAFAPEKVQSELDELYPDLRGRYAGGKKPVASYDAIRRNAEILYEQTPSLQKLSIALRNPTRENIDNVIAAARAEGITVEYVPDWKVRSGEIYVEKGLPGSASEYYDEYNPGCAIGDTIYLEESLMGDPQELIGELGHELGYIHLRNLYGRRVDIPYDPVSKKYATHILDHIVATKVPQLDFSSATSFSELYKAIDRAGFVRGTGKTYTPMELNRLISGIEARWRAGEQIDSSELNRITRTGGLRQTVERLVNSRIKDFRGANSFGELYKAIGKLAPIRGSDGRIYDAEELTYRIREIERMWRAGEHISDYELSYITRTGGLRDAVRALVED